MSVFWFEKYKKHNTLVVSVCSQLPGGGGGGGGGEGGKGGWVIMIRGRRALSE